jgi:hypothetical protein
MLTPRHLLVPCLLAGLLPRRKLSGGSTPATKPLSVPAGDLQVYAGPVAIPRIKADLLKCLEADGISSVEEAVGIQHRAR